jgi:hypothetical protein
MHLAQHVEHRCSAHREMLHEIGVIQPVRWMSGAAPGAKLGEPAL